MRAPASLAARATFKVPVTFTRRVSSGWVSQ
jgi:hypothetical protein